MQNEQKKFNNRYYFYAAICIAVICAALLLRSCGGEGVHNNGAGVDDVRGGITAGAESNTKLQEQLGGIAESANGVEGSLGRSEAAITNAEAAAGSVADNLNAAEAAITNCQRIVDGIKRRNEAGAQEP